METTGCEHTDRLIRLLMMLPDPESPTYLAFWEQVAQEHQVGVDYIKGNIAGPLHQLLLTPEKTPVIPRRNLAKYTLFFFGDPSDQLIAAVTDEIDPGAPNEAAGREWVRQVRAAAFEVTVQQQAPDRLRRSCTNWMRSLKIHAL